MAILELDKIIIKKPDSGIYCTYCGGDLKPNGKMKVLGWVISFVTFGKIKIRNYQCDNCKKKYIVV